MSASNGEGSAGPLDVGELLQLRLQDGSTLEYKVSAIFEDGETHAAYAVLEASAGDAEEGDVIVTDLQGNLIEDQDLAQEVLDNYLVFAEEAGDTGGTAN